MGAGKPVVEFEQPSSFEFTPENVEKAKAHIAKYPEGKQQSAVMPLLMLAQRQNGNWIPDAAMHVIADMLSMPYIRVFEVASFYTMYNLSP
ncbi:MAG: NAD(P)H-dependent oxidoreductase subunit E, partial [Rickettsiales bacterium]|nr:NAD(P)H-dependent oxidoreductase subunit E [Rickettsiales bacterium]